MESRVSKFFTLNIWHVMVFIGWLFGNIWVASAFKSTIDNHIKTEGDRIGNIEVNIKELTKITQELKEANSKFTQSFSYDDQRTIAMDIRITRLEDIVGKVSVMANDISWIKEYIIKSQKEQTTNK